MWHGAERGRAADFPTDGGRPVKPIDTKPGGTIMKYFVTASIVLAVLLLAATPHLATTDQNEQPAPKKLSPMMQEIHAALKQGDVAVLVLQQDLKSAPDEDLALELLRAIALKKQETESSILRIQERYARRAGNLEAATRIEDAIEMILHPDPVTPNAEARKEREARRTGGRGHE